MSENHRGASRLLGMAALAGLAMTAVPSTAAAAAGRAPTDGHVPGTVPPTMTVGDVTDGLASTPLYPLAGGPLDLLSNNAVVPVGGTEVSTFPLTAPFRSGLPLRDVQVVRSLLGSRDG